jgi:2-oxoglutarate/2-oxoacid ferredoxin oxidoreductase subunit beta
VLLHKVDRSYDPTDRSAALARIVERQKQQEYLTGLLYISPDQPEFHALNDTPEMPLNQLSYAQLNPGSQALAKTMARYR